MSVTFQNANLAQAENNPSDAAALIASISRLTTADRLPYVHGISDPEVHVEPQVVAVAAGKRLEDLTALAKPYLKRPYRPVGTSILLSVPSMLAHLERHADPVKTVVYVNTVPKKEQVIAVYDAHESNGVAGHQQFRAVFQLTQSDAWRAWSEIDGKPLTPNEFAEFIDARIGDVFEGTAEGGMKSVVERLGLRLASITDLVGVSRGLQVNADRKIKTSTTLSTGEISVAYEESHTNTNGDPFKIANAFLIAIPVFAGTAMMVCLARLSYKLNGQSGTMTWKVSVHDRVRTHEFAVQNTITELRAGCPDGVPVFEGVPADPAT